jgi:hypothetical protein
MKRLFIALGVLALAALIAFLGVTGYMASQRATRLNKALMEAEARIMDLETKNEMLQAEAKGSSQTARSESVPAAPAANAGSSSSSASSQAAAAQPGVAVPAGEMVRYAAFGGASNLMQLKGTSSVHDWQVQGRLIGGSAQFPAGFPSVPPADALTKPIPAQVSVMVPVRSLTSVHADGRPYSTAMDDIMYGKLLVNQFNRLTFSLDELVFKKAAESGGFIYDSVGQLAVAGKTNQIKMPVTVLKDGDRLRFDGTVGLKMTDFGITPPAPALAGVSIKTGDEVTVSFTWWARRAAPAAGK